MGREEALKRTDHYRCRLCGQLSPITETLHSLYRFLFHGRYRLSFDDCIIPCALQMAITVSGIALACKGKYVLRGILLCVIGALGAILVLAYSNHMLYVLIGSTVGALHIWLGILSFLKEK